MSSQHNNFQPSAVSLLHSTAINKKTGILFFSISIVFHGLFFGSGFFLQNFNKPDPLPPVIKIDLVSFDPESIPDAPPPEVEAEKEVPANEVISEKKPLVSDKKPEVKTIPTIKPDISLKTKPKNLKELIAEKKKKKSQKKQTIEKKPPPKKEAAAKKETQKKAAQTIKKKPDPEKIIEKQNQARLAKALERLQKKVAGQKDNQGAAGSDAAKQGYKAIDLYKMVLGSAIEQNWVFNDVLARLDQKLEVRILIKILKSGQIRDIIYETRSGNRYLDESAKKAIKKANPLPKLPAGMRSYDVVVIFTPKGLK